MSNLPAVQNFLKGLAIDPEPSQQPQGTYRFGKNGVFVAGKHQAEGGYDYLAVNWLYSYNGHAMAGNLAIIFTTNNTHSTIGLLNLETNAYITLFNDTAHPAGDKLNFHLDYPITGELSRNYANELIVAFRSDNNIPRYFNCDRPEYIEAVSDMNLQPIAPIPTAAISTISGGLVNPGAYFFAIALAQEDGSATQYLTIEGPTVLTEGETGKAIQLTITNISNRFEKVLIAVVRKALTGEIQCYSLPAVTNASGMAIAIYDGVSALEAITLEEIVVAPVYYNRAGSMTVLNDFLYLGNLTEVPETSLQSYASLIQAEWISTPNAVPGANTFMHEEAVALYISFTRDNGPKSKAYHIPGPALTVGDAVTDTTDGINLPAFQTNPTPAFFNAVTRRGAMCAWKNETETYPDIPEFSGADLPGAPDLRNQPVKHFRFPSIRWCKANLYSAEPYYGVRWLDSLSINLKGIVIPNGWTGYEIYYAKRNPGNSLVQANTLLQLNAAKAGVSTEYQSTGGNWDAVYSNNPTDGNRLYLNRLEARLLPFDALFNRFQITGSFLSFHVKHTMLDIRSEDHHIEDGSIGGDGRNAPIVLLMDHVNQNVTASAVPHTLRRVTDVKYVNNNTVLEKWNNERQETAVVASLATPVEGIVTQLLRAESQQTYIPTNQLPYSENSYLVSLISIKANLYNSFGAQILVKAGAGTINNVTIKGDAFISDYTYHSYGRNSANGNGYGAGKYGITTVRRIMCETMANLSKRFEEAGNIYSKYYPRTALISGAGIPAIENYTNLQEKTFDPNDFGYSVTLNAVNDLRQTVIFFDNTVDIYNHVHRVHRAGRLSRTNKFKSWRTLLPLDYYEMPKQHGEIMNLQGMGNILLIHMRYALFKTVNNTQLDTTNLSIALSSGDIFRIEPEETVADKHGMGGLQHKFAACMTPIGYAFYDAEVSCLYLYNNELKNISNLLLEFFQSLPKVRDDNPSQYKGILLGYDPRIKRFLLTFMLQDTTSYPVFTGAAMIPDLEVDDIVTINGKRFKFKGVNTSEFECTAPPPPCTLPTITGLSESYSIATGTIPLLTFTTTATSVTVSPLGVAIAEQVSGTTWKLVALTSVLDTYELTVHATNACGTTDQEVEITLTEPESPCIPPAVLSLLPATTVYASASDPIQQLICTITYNQSGLTIVLSNTTNYEFTQSGAVVSVYLKASQAVGTYNVTVNAENACGDVDSVLTTNVVAGEVLEGTAHEVVLITNPAWDGTTCPDPGSMTSIVWNIGVLSLANSTPICTNFDLSAPITGVYGLVEPGSPTNKLFLANPTTGVITLTDPLITCPL